MSHDPSRKHFLAKLLGLAAVTGLAPKLLAKPETKQGSSRPAEKPFALRPETRAVPRDEQVV